METLLVPEVRSTAIAAPQTGYGELPFAFGNQLECPTNSVPTELTQPIAVLVVRSGSETALLRTYEMSCKSGHIPSNRPIKS